MDFNQTIQKVASDVMRETELRLITIIEKRLGRVPTNEEVSARAHCGIFQGSGKREYKWDGVTILEVHPPTQDRHSYLFVE